MSRSGCRLAPLAALIALWGAAAPVCAQTRSAMTLGAEAAPPAGVIGFCRRDLEACRWPGSTTADVLAQTDAATRNYWHQIFVRTDKSPLPNATRPESFVPARPRAEETARASVPRAITSAYVGRRSSLWRDVTTANAEVNAAIRSGADLRTYRQEDYWAIPRATGGAKPVGDCEDFALAKRERLLALGVPAQTLSIALVTTRTGLSHAVLLVVTDEGEYVLDNLTPWVVHWTEARLTWRERQVPGQMLKWTHVITE